MPAYKPVNLIEIYYITNINGGLYMIFLGVFYFGKILKKRRNRKGLAFLTIAGVCLRIAVTIVQL